MKKSKKIFITLGLLIVGLPLLAQQARTTSHAAHSYYHMPEEYQEACDNQLPVKWRSQSLYATGVYTDTVPFKRDTTQEGSITVVDTIYTLNLTVHNTMFERKLEIRKGSRVEIRGRWYDKPGTYYDTIPSTTGCDSILHITIIWAENFRQVETQSICEGNSITWHGQTLTEEGIYYDSLTTTQGYDSVFQLHLSVHYPFVQYDSLNVCEEDTIDLFWRGRHIATPGDYQRVYRDQFGCDSTYHMHLTVIQKSPDTSITQYFCRNQGFEWRDTKYYEQKTFTDSLINQVGCDSIVHYKFIPRNNDFHSDRVNHYEGEPIMWRGKSYVIDSIYQDTLINQYGCDSIMELRLVRKYDLDRNIVRCKGDTAMFHNEIIEQNCHRNDTLLSLQGGDSIIHYHFSFASSFYSREFITICSNEYFPWTGHYVDDTTLMVLHEEGQYYDRHRNEAGCDSTYEIVVKHSPAWIKDSVVLICKDTNEMVSPVIWYDSKGKKYEFYPYQYLDTVIRDTMRHTLPREPHEAISSEDFIPITGGCDSIFNFHLIITDRCSELDSIPMCTDEQGNYIPIIVDGRTYDEPGLYSNTMPSYMHQELLMKDSTHTFRIWVAPKDTSYDTVRWCESRLPVIYHNGQKFYNHQSGDYKLHFTNRYGCDSLVHLHIDIVPTVYSPIQVYNQFCPGDTIYVKTPTGKIFRQAGEFTDTVPYGVEYEWEGCDSVIRYRIEYKQAFFHTETHFLGVDSAYKWVNHFNDTILTTAGVYYDSCKNVFDCDSVYQLRLIYAQPFYSVEEKHLCTNQLPYIWHRQSINASGTYYDSLYTVYKLDSVYQLNITIDSVFHDTIVKNFCYGDYFELSGRKITVPGNYSITLQSEDACDSVITYVVNFVTTTVSAPEVKYIAEGSSYQWRGRTLTRTGFYTDTVHTAQALDGGHACDSLIYAIQIYVVSPFYKEESTNVCSNQLPLIWHGQSINSTGVYWDSALSVHQIDSIYKLSVTVNPAYTKVVYHHLCQGDAFMWHGKYYTSSGTYPDTLNSVCGCDSVINHIVSFATATTTASQETLQCQEGKSVVWRDKEYSVEGLYFDTLRNQWGCDSVLYSMRLTVAHSFFQYDSVTICTNEFPYKWHNRDLQTAGIYWDSCRTQYGLDSIYKLRIDTLPSSFYSYNKFICQGSNYNFGIQVITEPGVYIDHLFKTNGCDSTIRCVVNYAPHYFYDEVITYVNDSELPISWHGKELDHEGYFFDSLSTEAYGCDSIHRVYVKKSKSYFFTEEKELCDSQLPYTWHGQTLTEAGVYSAPYTTQYGLDSIYQLTLIVNPTERTTLNVQICPGETYQLYGKAYSQPGIYFDTLSTEEGCYHLVELRLNLYNTVKTDLHHELCPGDTLYINGQAITQSGTYEETTKSLVTSCDSVVRHIVGFRTAFYQNEAKTINPGDVYVWHKNGVEWPLSEAGTYFDSCTNQFGCDSIYRLELKVNQVEYHFPAEVVTVCESALPYIWQGTSFYNDTIATANYKTKLGRDSIYTLELHISRAKDSVVYLNYCDGGSHEFKGKIYTRSAQLTDTITNSHGCDSVRIHYTINFYPRYSLTQLIELKNGECYHFGEGTPMDTVICTSGIYYRHFTTVNGCDSLVTLKVEACANDKETLIRKDLCEGETFTLGGQVISTSGRYYSYLKTADGCDSVVIYAINIHPSFNDYRSVSICHGSSYCWKDHFNDTVLTKAGLYVDSIPTESGCYNTYTLQISYKNQDWSDTVISMCADKLPYLYKGHKYYVDTIFYDTLGANISGCDSILRWHYEINQHCSPYDQYTRCSNQTKYIEGLLIDHEGIYSVHRLTELGEDSIYRFIVRDVQPYERYVSLAPACDSIIYNGKTILARGKGRESFQETFHLKTVDGCDSIEHITFTIHSSSPKYVHYATITDYESYRFEGRDYRLPGTYPVHFFNEHMCDSVRELVLTVLTTNYEQPVKYTFCKGDQSGLQIFGKMYYPTQDTVIYDTLRIGGVPTIRTAVVYMHQPFTITNFDPRPDQLVCSSSTEVWFDVNYAVKDQGALPEFYDIDFVKGELEAMPKHRTYTVTSPTTLSICIDGGGVYVNPGYYTYRIKFHTDSCSYSDTTLTGSVTVLYPAQVMKTKWDNVVTLLNADYNGGHWNLIPPYVWQITAKNGSDKTVLVAPASHTQPYLSSAYLQDGDEVRALLYREGYSKAVWSCPFIFEGNVPYSSNPIVVYPTVVKKASPVHVQTPSQGEYVLYNTTGQPCQKGIVLDGDNTVTMPALEGCYLLQVIMNDGNETLERVVVY